MANEQNLRPAEYKLSVEEAKRGGIASGKARRVKKTLREIGDMLGGLEIKNKENRAILKNAGVCENDMIEDVAMMFQLRTKAIKGDIRAIELLAKLRGQLKDQVEQTNIEMPAPRLAKDKSEKQ